MNREWKEFTIPSATVGGLHVTVSEKGELLIGVEAYSRLGKPEAVILLYDEKNALVGLRPAHPRVPNAYPLIAARRGRHKLLRAARFWNHHGLRFRTRTLFESPAIEDGTLVLDLAKTHPVRRRTKLV